MSELKSYIEKKIAIFTNDGRMIIGVLKGFDQTTNVILQHAIERVFSTEGAEEVPLGLYLIRGDNIAVIGELDEEIDSRVDWEQTIAPPLPPIIFS